MSQGRRPNLLVLCTTACIEAVAAELTNLCAQPFHVSVVPGCLNLPPKCGGTLFVGDVAALTLDQQIELHDWMNQPGAATQVVSITSKALLPLVQDGRFLEGLFYRINVIYMVAAGRNNN